MTAHLLTLTLTMAKIMSRAGRVLTQCVFSPSTSTGSLCPLLSRCEACCALCFVPGIPAALRGLSWLERLDLSSNPRMQLDSARGGVDTLVSLSGLRQLDLSKLDIDDDTLNEEAEHGEISEWSSNSVHH